MTDYMEKRKNETLKKVYMTVIGVLAAAAVVFAVMWFMAKNDQSDEAAGALTAAEQAADAFAGFAEDGNGRDYIRAVSEYYVFCLKMDVLTTGTNRASYSADAHALYEVLIGQPEYGQAHAAEIADIMKLLAKDIYEPSAYASLKQLADGAA